MAGTLGSAYVQVFPVMKGFRKSVEAEMGNAGKSGGSKLESAIGKAGASAGNKLGKGLSDGVKAATGSLGQSSLQQLEANVNKTQSAYSAAMRKAEDAAGKVRVAQAKLAEAQEKYGAGSSQVVAAEERLAKAERDSAAAMEVAQAKATALADAQQTLKSASEAAAGVAESSSSGFGSIASAGLSKLGSAASSTFSYVGGLASQAGSYIANGIAGNLDKAIARVDTLNNFPKVMESLGFTDAEGKQSIEMLTDYFDDGLPGSLDSMAASVQKFSPIIKAMGGSLEDTTTFTMALNDAFLASGNGEEAAARGMEQYSQMLAAGKVDAGSWRTLMEVMPGQMDQLAKSMLGGTASAQDLYNAMQDGTLSFEDLNAAIIDLDQNGNGNIASFKDQALAATGGIGTSLSKLSTGFTKAGASILDAIGQDRIAAAAGKVKGIIENIGKTIGGVIDKFLNSDEGGIGGAFSGLAPAIGGVLGALSPLLSQLPQIGGLFRGLTGPVGLVIGVFVSMWQNSESLRNAMGQLLPTITGLVGTVGGSLGPVLQTVSGIVGQVAGMLGDVLAAVIQNIIIPLIPKIVAILQTVIPIVSMVIGKVAEIVSWLVAHLVPAVTSVISVVGKVVGIVASVIGSVVSTVVSGVSRVISTITGIRSRILGALRGAGSWLVGIGRNIIDGLTRGIRNAVGNVASAITSGLSDAIGKAKSFLGIASPSKLMDKEIGRYMALGVSQGFTHATPAMSNSIREDLRDTVGGLGYNVPVNWAANATGYGTYANSGSAVGVGGKVVNQTINVQATDPASVAAVIEARQRAALGA